MSTTTSQSAVVLVSDKDWDPWKAVIQTASLKYDLWRYINPSTPKELVPQLVRPEKPTPDMVKSAGQANTNTNTEGGFSNESQQTIGRLSIQPPAEPAAPSEIRLSDLNTIEQQLFQDLKQEWLYERRLYDKKVEAMAELRSKIQGSIHRNHFIYTQDCDTVWQMMNNLKNRFAPSDKARELDITSDWLKAIKRPQRGTEIDQWIQDLETAYDKAVVMRLPEVQGLKPHYGLAHAMYELEPAYAGNLELKLVELSDNQANTLPFRDEIQKVRNLRRITRARGRAGARHGAFAASLQGRNADGSPKVYNCICGEQHRYAQCRYLIESLRPDGWTANPTIQRKVDDAMATLPFFKKTQIKRAQEWAKNQQGDPASSSSNQSRLPASCQVTSGKASFEAVVFRTNDATSATPKYELHYSTILDSGSTCHVGNIRSRFKDLRSVTGDDDNCLVAGDSLVPIEGYGTYTVTLQTKGYPNGRVLELKNTAYVPTFSTSIVSLRILNTYGVFWDNKLNRLVHGPGNTHFADTPIMFNQWVLEYIPVPKSQLSALQTMATKAALKAHSSRHPRPNNAATLDQWHEMLGHLYPEALHKLKEHCQGVVITTNKLTDHKCENCCLSDSKRVPYRYPTARHPVSFGKVHWDLITMDTGMGGENHVLHFVDSCTRMHHVYHLLGKNQRYILPAFQHFVNYARRRWGFTVKIFHGDGETAISIGDEFDDWIVSCGFVIEKSPPHTQAQNGDAERSGGVIIGRGRNMRITSNLPEVLWPEILTCAGYLLNRSPTKSLGWQTPIGFLENYLGNNTPKPSLNHLVPYGCRAYSFIKNQPKLDRLQPRAHIGYLVGYDSTNVFRIWIPSKRTVISTRDVVFDVTKKYDPNDDQSFATDEIIETIQELTLDVEDLIEDWETLPPLFSYERSIEKPGDTIVVQEPPELQEAAGSLPTPQETPEPEPQPAQETPTDQVIPEHTTITAGTINPGTTNAGTITAGTINPGTTNAGTINAGTSSPYNSSQFELLNATNANHVPEVNESLQPPNQPKASKASKVSKAPKGYAHPDAEERQGITKGLTDENVVQGKRTRKPAAYHFDRIYWDLNDAHFAEYHSAFLAGTTHSQPRIHSRDLPALPKHVKDLEKHPFGKDFFKSMEVEYQTLQNQGTFESCPVTGISLYILPLMWVFTYKLDEDGYLLKFKARLVVRGDLQKSQFKDTYAATLAARVFRALMATAAYFDLDIHQFDAINAFTNSEIDELVYVRYPDGFQVPGHCLKLRKALYGLPRSPLLWFNHLSNRFRDLGLMPSPESACLWSNDKLIVFFYVDDIVVLSHPSNQQAYQSFRSELLKAYKMREMGELKWFLGIRVLRDRKQHKIWLCQDSYIAKICNQFRPSEPQSVSKAPKTPMSTEPLLPYDGTASKDQIQLYSQMVGSATYSTAITRPDTAFTTKTLAESLQNPGPDHVTAVHRCLNYLENTQYHALELGGPESIVPCFGAASDAAYADDLVTRRSTEGSIFQLFGGTIDWQSKKQATVTTSTTEAELLALSHICAWLLWWGRFFTNISLDIDQDLTVHCDNLQTVGLMIKESPKLVTKLKHIDIHQHWLRQETANGNIKVEWISTNQMVADGLTKALPPQRHAEFLKQLNLVDIKHLIKAEK